MSSRILVCGSNYGRSYFEGLAGSDERPVALFAQGSQRSMAVAERFEVPMITRLEDLPDDLDLACCAMNSSANPTVLAMIRQGLPVLCEFPQGEAFLASAIRAAADKGVPFHLNGHFADLPAQQAWIAAARELARESRPRLVEAAVSDRALFAALDLLRRAFGRFEAEAIEGLSAPIGWRRLRFAIGQLPVELLIQVGGFAGEAELADGSGDYVVDCRVGLITDEATLQLTSLVGPVLHLFNANRMTDPNRSLCHLWSSPASIREFARQRLAANRRAVELVLAEARGADRPEWQNPDDLIALGAAWDRLSELLVEREVASDGDATP